MLNVKILGGGCKNCDKLESNTVEALKEMGVEYKIEHVKDFAKIAEYGVMKTPALVVDEKVLISGRVAKKSEIEKILNK